MLHSLTIGHLDLEAVRRGKMHLLRPLDMAVAMQVLREIGTVDEYGKPWLGKARVDFRDGYIVCPWLGACPRINILSCMMLRNTATKRISNVASRIIAFRVCYTKYDFTQVLTLQG